MSKNISNTNQAKQSCKTGVSGSVFHSAIYHINCDENISQKTVNAINEMVDCIFSKEEIKESKKFIRNVFKKNKNK